MVRLFILMGMMALQAGCALSPQQVTLKPRLSVSSAAYGKQQVVSIRVEDHRATSVLGTRGGVYGETSTIELGNDYKNETAYVIANALTRWDFRSQVNGSNTEALQFVLNIDKLTYVPDKNPAVGKIHISAAISVTVERGKQRYQGHYSASGDISHMMTPTEEKNTKQINDIFSLALQKMFEDKKLIDFLRQ